MKNNPTNSSEEHLKNFCAVSNYIHILLTQGYHFKNLSFPFISFEKKVRNKENKVSILFITVLDFNLCYYHTMLH